jgi:hypothetical protein
MDAGKGVPTIAGNLFVSDRQSWARPSFAAVTA